MLKAANIGNTSKSGEDIIKILDLAEKYVDNLSDTHLLPEHEKIIYEIIGSGMYLKAKLLLQAEHGSLFIKENNSLIRTYASAPVLNKIFPREQGNINRVYETQNPTILSADYITHIRPELEQLSIGSDITIPLTYKNKNFGVLSFFSPSHFSFNKSHLYQLQSLLK